MHERNFICMQTKKSISTKLMDWLMRKRAFGSLNISWNSTETSQQHGVIKKKNFYDLKSANLHKRSRFKTTTKLTLHFKSRKNSWTKTKRIKFKRKIFGWAQNNKSKKIRAFGTVKKDLHALNTLIYMSRAPLATRWLTQKSTMFAIETWSNWIERTLNWVGREWQRPRAFFPLPFFRYILLIGIHY